jgi:hypothetical protein
VVLSSAGGAPVESSGGSAVLSAFAALRSCGAHFPLAGVRETAAPVFEDLRGGDDADQGDDADGARWRLSGAELRQLPVHGGTSPSPRLAWRSGGGAPSVCVAFVNDAGFQKDFFVIFSSFLDFSVMTLV